MESEKKLPIQETEVEAVSRTEEDTTGDGQVDTISFDVNGDGRADVIVMDVNGDGTTDAEIVYLTAEEEAADQENWEDELAELEDEDLNEFADELDDEVEDEYAAEKLIIAIIHLLERSESKESAIEKLKTLL